MEKMTDIAKQSADYINDRQRLIMCKGGEMIGLAIEIGEELIKVKASLAHGEFMPWCKENITVKDRQVNKYMQLANGKFALEGEFGSIDDAVKYLSDLNKPKPQPLRCKEKTRHN